VKENDVTGDPVVSSTWEEEEKTFIRESEVKYTSNRDLPISLIGEDNSDEEQEPISEVAKEVEFRNWEQLLKMRIPSSQWADSTSYNTSRSCLTQDNAISDEGTSALPAGATLEQLPVTESVDLLDKTLASHRSIDTPVARSSIVDSDHTLKNGIVTIPELGSFKQRTDFMAIATRQLIEKMLSESITPSIWLTIATPETESQCPPDTSQIIKASDISIPDAIDTSQSISLQQKDTPLCRREVEEIRRGYFYDSLVRAQHHYAEKITTPSSSTCRFTKDQWNTLGEDLKIEDWEGGFVIETPYKRSRQSELKKENMPSWKGKEKAVDIDSEDEDAATLMMVF
jgi:hypothetical protein